MHWARGECALLGLIDGDDVVDGTVVRMPKAYPVYDSEYRDALAEIREWLRLQTPQPPVDRAQWPALLQQPGPLDADSRVRGSQHRRGRRNPRRLGASMSRPKYHEVNRASGSAAVSGERSVPQRAGEPTVADLVGDAFARYDAVALGAALAMLCAAGLFIATAALLLEGGPAIGLNLSLAGNYLFGYEVSWTGALIGAAEAGAVGFFLGWLIAKLANRVIGAEQRRFTQTDECADRAFSNRRCDRWPLARNNGPRSAPPWCACGRACSRWSSP